MKDKWNKEVNAPNDDELIDSLDGCDLEDDFGAEEFVTKKYNREDFDFPEIYNREEKPYSIKENEELNDIRSRIYDDPPKYNDDSFMKDIKSYGDGLDEEPIASEEKYKAVEESVITEEEVLGNEESVIKELDISDKDKKISLNKEHEIIEDDKLPDISEQEIAVGTGDEIEPIDKSKIFEKYISTNGDVLENYISGDSKVKSIVDALLIGINLAKLFKAVHEKEYCFNAITASDIVVSNDNKRNCFLVNADKIVAINDDKYDIIIDKVCAPEILRGEARPNKKSDIHTLAYIIFGVLFRSNPFEGSDLLSKIFYEPKEELEYYKNPVFVYDEKNNINAPVRGIHSMLIKYWNNYYSEEVRNLFKKIFVDGLENPEYRETEDYIIYILEKDKTLREGISKPVPTKPIPSKPVPSKQKEETTYEKLKLDIHVKRFASGGAFSKKKTIDLEPGTKITNEYIGYSNEKKYNTVGVVIQHASNKSIIGIKNVSNHTWIVKKGDQEKTYEMGKVVILREGLEIEFYPEGEDKFKYYVTK